MILEDVIEFGNRGHIGWSGGNNVTCVDGITLSVIAGGGTYCHPRPAMCFHTPEHELVLEPDGQYEQVTHDYPGPYDEVEVGFPSVRPEPWDEWRQYAEDFEDPTGTVYSYVPVDLVRAFVDAHSGEVVDAELVDQRAIEGPKK